jgi:pSer/pThr/pTyr-binding forkhead associated (FHA) protein
MTVSSHTAKRIVPSPPFAAPHVFVLAAVEGPDRDALFRVARPETSIGRDPSVDLRIKDEEVSKHHCTIRYDAGCCHLLDAESLNGTLVNGRPLRPGIAHRLRHLDEIEIGGTRLLFLAGRFTERTTVTRP